MEGLHLMRIGYLMKDSSYGCKSQKINIKLYANLLIDIAVMGVSALVSRAKGAKHQGKVKSFNPVSELFYKTSTSTTTSSASSTNSSLASNWSSPTNQSNNMSANQSKVDTLMSSLSVTYAEIRWIMKILICLTPSVFVST